LALSRILTLGVSPGPFVRVRVRPGRPGFQIDLDEIDDARTRELLDPPGEWAAIALRSYLLGPIPWTDGRRRMEAIEVQLAQLERLVTGGELSS
jgi:hypothetical protein